MSLTRGTLYDVSLEILQKCLNNCLHCSSNSCHNSKAILRLDTIKQIIDDIIYLGAKRLCLSGGEPFLHPDIIEIVEYATQKGLILDVYSSGIVGEYNLEKSISKEMLWECKKRGLNRIMFNVQAADSVVYDAIMNTKYGENAIYEDRCIMNFLGNMYQFYMSISKWNRKLMGATR